MGSVLVIIRKDYNGTEFVNTHCLTNNDTDGTVTPAQLQGLLGTKFLDNTGGLLPASNLGIDMGPVWRLLEFERLLYPSIVKFKRILFTDRKNYQPGPDDERAYKGYNLNYTGATNHSTGSTIDAGDHILSITRTAADVSSEDGEIEYRCLLNKSEFINNGRRMLDWADQQARDYWSGALDDALATSGLSDLFGAGFDNNDWAYTIPHYARETADGNVKGDLIGAYWCEGLSIYGPLSRQVRQGRRKKPVS